MEPALGSQVARGLAWKAASQLLTQLSRLIVGLILARLLTPREYGLAAMVLVFSLLLFVFTDLAFGAAIVQRPELSEADRSTVFWTSLGAGAAFTAIGVAVAGPIAAFYGESEVAPLFAVFSVAFLLTALGTVQVGLLQREMRFRALEIRLMAATLVGAAVGITSAARGLGAWAIVAQQLAIAAASTTLLWAFVPWRPRFVYSLHSLQALGGFSAKLLGQRLLYYVHRNADNLLVGRFLGPAALGAYALAYNVMLIPISRMAAPVQQVLFPAFSRIQDETARIAAIWVRSVRLLAAAAAPAMVTMIVVAPDFVPVVLGERWRDAVPVLQILAWVGLVQTVQSANATILQARGRAGTLLRFEILSTAVSLGAFAVGLRWGIVGVAAAYAVVNTAVQPLFTWLTARSIGVSPLLVVRGLSGVLQASSAAGLAALGTRVWLIDAGVPPEARLGLTLGVAVIVFVPLCAWRAPEVWSDFKRLRRHFAGPADATPV